MTWTQSPALYGRGVTACDFDEDGDQDIYVSAYWQMPNQLWLNDGSGNFTDVAAARGVRGDNPAVAPALQVHGHTIGSCWGDMNNDGYFDLFVGDFNHHDGRRSQDATFYRNTGPGGGYTFVKEKILDGADWQESYSSPALGDYDNDGDLDLYFTTIYSGDAGRLYRNDGNWNFVNVTADEDLSTSDTISYQAAWADFDRDGDLDLVTNGKLYKNSSSQNGNHWLEAHMLGDGITVNRAAIGVQVRIDLGSGVIITRQVEGGTGQGNQNDLTLHFGLGGRSTPVDLEVIWPSGVTQMVNSVAVDQVIAISQGTVILAEVEVSNGIGATDVTDLTATLNGDLLSTAGDPTTDVIVYWGTSDGDTNTWANEVLLNDPGAGPFSTDLSGLISNTLYYYRCFATNTNSTAWASTSAQFTTSKGLPFTEPFDERNAGNLNGQGGWVAAPANAAVVQSICTQGGSTQACDVSTGFLHHPVSSVDATNLVWTDFYLKPVPGAHPVDQLDAYPNATAIVFVEEGSRFLVVYDGASEVVLSAKPPVPVSGFVRFTVCSDYTARTWDLWMNNQKMAEDLGFFNATRSQYASFGILDGGASSVTSVIDTINVSLNSPLGPPITDDDGDGLDDNWEIFYFGSTNVSNGGPDDDWDGNGFIDLHEFLAGTDPTNFLSALAIIDLGFVTGSNVVIKWSSASNRFYALDSRPGLSEPWTNILSNIPATPAMNQDTVNVEVTPAFYRIRLEQ